jgi:hypothetical protein
MSDIKVNASDWNKLSEEHKSQITSIMKEHGFLKGAEKIVGDAHAPKTAEAVRAVSAHLQASAKAHKAAAPSGATAAAATGFNFCKIGCDIAEAAAVAACALVPTPGNAICVVAAHGDGEFCRSKC